MQAGIAKKEVIDIFTINTPSPAKTTAIAKRIGAICPRGAVFALSGDLGAGKTLFVRGLARGLGFLGEVTSPTFNLLNIYGGKIRILHFDLYRLTVAEELYDIGFYEYTEDLKSIIVIEWFDKFPEEMPKDYVHIAIKRISPVKADAATPTPDTSGYEEMWRSLQISLTGTRLKPFFEEMKKIVNSSD